MPSAHEPAQPKRPAESTGSSHAWGAIADGPMEQLPPTGGSPGAILYTSQKSGELAPLLMPVTPLLWSFLLTWLTVPHPSLLVCPGLSLGFHGEGNPDEWAPGGALERRLEQVSVEPQCPLLLSSRQCSPYEWLSKRTLQNPHRLGRQSPTLSVQTVHDCLSSRPLAPLSYVPI